MDLPSPSNWTRVRAGALALAAVLLLASGISDSANTDPDHTVAHILMTRDLAGIPGKQAVMLTVEYLPGGASLPHRHNANVFVYVLEGAIRMQVDGARPVTLTAGQTFYEGPQDIHRVSANASATKPAKFLVFMVANKGQLLSQPVTAPPAAH